MKLTEALERDVSIRLVCKSCGAHQPAYVHEMIDKHGPDTELDIAAHPRSGLAKAGPLPQSQPQQAGHPVYVGNQRLVAIKRQYEPDNVFRVNQTINPAN